MVGVHRSDKEQYGNKRVVQLPGVPKVKVDGCFAETWEVFEYLGCF